MAKAAQPAAKKRAAKPAKAAPPSPILSTAQAAELLEITAERVRQLVKSGHIEKRGKDQIPLLSAVRGYIRFLKEDERRSSKSASASRVQDSRAREIDLKVAEREGRLVDVVEHRDIFAEVFGTLKAGLAGVPARVTRDMDHRRKLETEIDDILRQAADRFEQASRDLGDAGPAVEADSRDDAR